MIDERAALIAEIDSFLADAPEGKPHTGYRYGELLARARAQLAADTTHDHGFAKHISSQLLGTSVRCGTCGAIVTAADAAPADPSFPAGFAMSTATNVDAAPIEAADVQACITNLSKEWVTLCADFSIQDIRNAVTFLAGLAREREELRAWVIDLQSGMYVNCVYCGHRYGLEDKVPATMADVLKEHIEQCQKHPMSALKAELAAARKEIAEHCIGHEHRNGEQSGEKE